MEGGGEGGVEFCGVFMERGVEDCLKDEYCKQKGKGGLPWRIDMREEEEAETHRSFASRP